MKILLITPKRKKVDLFFVGALLTETLVADLLPSKWRKIWLTGFIIVESGTVVYNYYIGIRF